MKTRPYDPSGDWVPVTSTKQMVDGKNAIAKAIEFRLRFYYGEWWENREIGFKVPEFLINTVRSGELSLLANYIAAYVSDTEGVRGVIDVQMVKTGHDLKVSLVAKTNEGGNTTVEVDLSGVL